MISAEQCQDLHRKCVAMHLYVVVISWGARSEEMVGDWK